MIARFETNRLVLRIPTLEDVDPLARMYADPLVMRYIGTGATRTREQVIQGVEWMIARHHEHGYGLWVAETKADGRVIGRCGLIVQDVEGRQEVELAYLLGREHWGHGYATEAALEIRRVAFGELRLNRLIALIHAGNTASKRVAEKAGLRREKTVDFHGIPAELFSTDVSGMEVQ
jgi:ribosomal-protein-alanine N-acetyltransferase